MVSKKSDKELWLFAIIIMFGFAAVFRLMVGVGYINEYDTYWYRSWALDLPNGMFDVYLRAKDISLDYPPLYLIPLYFIGHIYKIITPAANTYTQMLIMKFFPLLFDMLCGVVIYRICSKKFSQKVAFVASLAWLFNPSMFFNSTMWGQTDSIMAFFLILSFWYLSEKKFAASGVIFAVACLTKYQSLLFAPVFGMQLLYESKFKIKQLATTIGAGLATIFIVFLPFSIACKNPLLIIDVYVTGAGTYEYCSLYCFNFYGMVGLDWHTRILDTTKILGPITYQHFGYFMVFLAIAVLIAMYMFAKEEKRNPWVGGLFFMQCVFMFMTRMHERYQVVVLPFVLLAYFTTRKKGFGISFILLTIMTGLNQFMILLFHQYGDLQTPWEANFPFILRCMSVINFALFIYVSYLCVAHFLSKRTKSDLPQPQDITREEVTA